MVTTSPEAARVKIDFSRVPAGPSDEGTVKGRIKDLLDRKGKRAKLRKERTLAILQAVGFNATRPLLGTRPEGEVRSVDVIRDTEAKKKRDNVDNAFANYAEVTLGSNFQEHGVNDDAQKMLDGKRLRQEKRAKETLKNALNDEIPVEAGKLPSHVEDFVSTLQLQLHKMYGEGMTDEKLRFLDPHIFVTNGEGTSWTITYIDSGMNAHRGIVRRSNHGAILGLAKLQNGNMTTSARVAIVDFTPAQPELVGKYIAQLDAERQRLASREQTADTLASERKASSSGNEKRAIKNVKSTVEDSANESRKAIGQLEERISIAGNSEVTVVDGTGKNTKEIPGLPRFADNYFGQHIPLNPSFLELRVVNNRAETVVFAFPTTEADKYEKQVADAENTVPAQRNKTQDVRYVGSDIALKALHEELGRTVHMEL